MRQFRGWGWVSVVALLAPGACDQQLEMPQTGAAPATSVSERPSQGTTGMAGAPPEEPVVQPLPVPDQPAFTGFGGAGGDGEANVETPSRAGAGGVSGRGGTSSGRGGGGGHASGGASAGMGGAGGRPPMGGSAGRETVLGGDAGQAGASEPPAGPPPLFFSEYVEGSGSLKALEIYAPVATSLEGCELETYFNGKSEPSRLALHGELASGAVQVLCSTTLATAQPGACTRATSLTFNGDDALALSCNGAVLDVIGQIGVDPGDSWENGATLDHTLRRRCSVTHGRSANEPFDVDAEWVTFGVDTFSDLGKRSCEAP